MDTTETDRLVSQLAAGFEALQGEYQTLHSQHQALERKLATAREQYNELVKLCGSGAITTPPLSLASSPAQRTGGEAEQGSIADILERNNTSTSEDIARKVRLAAKAVDLLQPGLVGAQKSVDGVRIWSGPSADRHDSGSRIMPSISESPLEQDFTIEGKPSKLGCPFASMANKKLSSHAASVLGRYNQGSNGGAPSTPLSSVSRVNGKESFARKGERRSSFVDPIKAEMCGLSDHDEESPYSERAIKEHHDKQDNVDVGVCPIRFLDQHSPEEVATYFERHKHELPRSHEVCVKRYQSNEKQIRELDAKYGTLVSMIQGLGAKHKDFLPKEPEDGDVDGDVDAKSNDKVLKWASSVSAQAAEGRDALAENEDRQPRFERPLRDVRVGESPSRPWGIHVPPQHLEKVEGRESIIPAQLVAPPTDPHIVNRTDDIHKTAPAKCPFDFTTKAVPASNDAKPPQPPGKLEPAFITADTGPTQDEASAHRSSDKASQFVITGPVFIGYSAEDAAKILQESGFAAR